MKTPIDFRVWADELRGLGENSPDREQREKVESALNCPYEGIQSVAAQVLGQWGGRQSADALQSVWLECVTRPNGLAICRIIDKALSKCVDESDAPWVLDAFFDALHDVGTFQPYHKLLISVACLPVEAVRDRLETESYSSNRNARRAAMDAIARMPFPDRQRLLEHFVEDKDPSIHRLARFFLTRDFAALRLGIR